MKMNNKLPKPFLLLFFVIVISATPLHAQARASFSLGFATINSRLAPQSIVRLANDPIETPKIELQQNKQLNGSLLNHPNPFSWQSGTTIGYELSTDMTVTLHVYNMDGFAIYSKTFTPDNAAGGKSGYNTIPFTKAEVGYNLPAGIYFAILMNEGKTLGKLKMAIIP